VAVIEANLDGEIVRRLVKAGFPPAAGEVTAEVQDPAGLLRLAEALQHSQGADLVLGASLVPHPDKQELHCVLLTPGGQQTFTRWYGGPPQNGPIWAVNHAIDAIRLYALGH
jgi:hypothetical protein